MDLRGRVREGKGAPTTDCRAGPPAAGAGAPPPSTFAGRRSRGAAAGTGAPAGAALGRGDELAPLLRRQVEGAMGAGGAAAGCRAGVRRGRATARGGEARWGWGRAAGRWGWGRAAGREPGGMRETGRVGLGRLGFGGVWAREWALAMTVRCDGFDCCGLL